MPLVSMEEIVREIQEYVRRIHPYDQLRNLKLTITLQSGEKIMHLAPCFKGDPPAPSSTVPALSTRHSADFRSVHWHGADYSFSPVQAAVIRQLWEAWEDGTPNVGGDTLLETAGSEATRLRDLFRENPAWGVMIVPGARRTYRLAVVE